MDALDINEKNIIQSIPTYFGGQEEEDDIPDMEEFDEADNVVENDPVSCLFLWWMLLMEIAIIFMRLRINCI